MAGSSNSTDLSNLKIGFVGVGNMAQAIIEGWFKAGVVKPAQLMASAPSDRNLSIMKEKGIQTTHNNCEVVRACNVVILACKPYHVEAVSAEIKADVTPDKIIISVIAGKTIATLESGLPDGSKVVRTMPNVASAVMAGATMLVRGTNMTDADMGITRSLFVSIGLVEEGSDALCNVHSGYGSAIAFCCLVLEGLSDGAVQMGMQRHIATKMAAQILMGTGKMQLETGLHPGVIKDSVCSPGGSTIAGIHAMEKGGVRSAMMDAMEAAVSKSTKL